MGIECHIMRIILINSNLSMSPSPPTPGTPEDGQKKHPVPERRHPISSADLFAAGDEVVIAHEGEQYRLRRTRNGKLILTK